jgi:hypothetical protein
MGGIVIVILLAALVSMGGFYLWDEHRRALVAREQSDELCNPLKAFVGALSGQQMSGCLKADRILGERSVRR